MGVLQGLQQWPNVSLEGDDSFKLPKQDHRGVLLQLVSRLSPCSTSHGPHVLLEGQQHLPDPLKDILREYAAIFQEPKGLPPPRSHDHSIQLLPGVQPVSVRPYHYPFYQNECHPAQS